MISRQEVSWPAYKIRNARSDWEERMATPWVLIPCLKALFAEFDRIAPSRDKASDGSIGDTAHQKETSDHNPDEVGKVPIQDADKKNEVHAIDVDNNLNQSDLTMEKVVQFILGRCRSGKEKRLRYIIYNKRIWDYRTGWTQKTYTGPSPHTEHAHFSASYDSTYEASTASWHLEDIPVALTEADKTWLQGQMYEQALKAVEVQRDDIANDVFNKIMNTGLKDATLPASDWLRNLRQIVVDMWALQMKGTTLGGDPIPAAGAFGQILENTDNDPNVK